MSAFGVRADVLAYPQECPNLAKRRRSNPISYAHRNCARTTFHVTASRPFRRGVNHILILITNYSSAAIRVIERHKKMGST